MKVIEEKIELGDSLNGLFYKAQHSKLYKKKLWINRILLFASLLLICHFLYTKDIIPTWVIIVAVIFSILVFIFYPVRFKKLNVKHYRKYLENKKIELGDSYTDKDIFKLSETNILIIGDGIELKLEHQSIDRCIEIKTHLIIFLKSGGTISFNKNSNNYKDFQSYFKALNVDYQLDLNWKI